MIFPQELSRAAAIGVLAAEYQRGFTFDKLSAVARELAARVGQISGPAVEPPGELRQRLAGSMPPPLRSSAERSRVALQGMIFLLDVCALGTEAALARRLAEVASLDDGGALLSALGGLLDATGLARDVDGAALARLAPGLSRLPTGRLVAALQFLGMSKAAAAGFRRRVFEEVAAAVLTAAAEAGDADRMLAIESFLYEAHLKAIETPEHHTATLAVIEAAYAALAPQPWPVSARGAPAARPRVAFVIPNGNLLAHTEVMLAFFAGLADLDAPPIEPYVLIHAATDGGELGRQLDRMSIAWAAFGAHPTQERRYDAVRDWVAERQVDGVVFVSVPLHLAYACRRPLGPAQIWWSMKFPLPNFPTLDGRVFYRSLFDQQVVVAGRMWRGGPLAFTPPAAPDPAAVAAIRAQYPGMTLLGTVAREEKIANDDYLRAVVSILRRHPDACFLWTGRSQLPQVQAAFERGGVADRCHFVGWVDPAPYIAAFDLFLETYPLTGLMTGWSMALGKSVISVGEMGFIGAYLEPLMAGAFPAAAQDLSQIATIFAAVHDRLPGLWAEDPAQMEPFADVLLADADLRAALGAAQQRYVELYMTDRAASAATQARHFADIVRESHIGDQSRLS